MAPTVKTRVNLSLLKKKEILEDLDRNLQSKTEIAKKYGIPKTTLSSIIKAKEKIFKVEAASCLDPKKIRSREAKFPQLEEALILWMRKMRGQKIPIDGKLLKEQADTYALRMGIDVFKGSDGWLQKFKARHGLTFKKVCGESASVNQECVQQWQDTRLKQLLAEFPPEDIFNADETGLMWKLLPDRTLSFKDENCNGSKKAKCRITILLAANMTGTEKLPLLVIGKAQKPRCFKGIRSLPTTYKANSKAWMTGVIYEDWLRQLDRKFAMKGRKVLFVMDNCTAHVDVPDLKAIRVEFLPPNVTSILQPMDQGIIQSFKRHYRRMLLKRIILCLEMKNEMYSVTLLAAIHLACSAWNQVTAETIAHCFRHAGFSSEGALATPIEADDSAAADDELLETLRQKKVSIPETTSFEDYSKCDNDIVCVEVLTDDEIVRQVTETEEDDGAVCLSEDETESKPSSKEAVAAAAILRRYFEGENAESVDLINILEGHIFASARLSQSKITGYISSH